MAEPSKRVIIDGLSHHLRDTGTFVGAPSVLPDPITFLGSFELWFAEMMAMSDLDFLEFERPIEEEAPNDAVVYQDTVVTC